MRELVNYRHPSPRRVWKGGSELWLTTSLSRDCSGSGGSAGVFQTSVLCTRNGIFVLGPQKSLYCVWSKIKIRFRWRRTAPAGTLGGAPSMFLCLADTKRAYFMSPRHTNRAHFMYFQYRIQDVGCIKTRMSYFWKLRPSCRPLSIR